MSEGYSLLLQDAKEREGLDWSDLKLYFSACCLDERLGVAEK